MCAVKKIIFRCYEWIIGCVSSDALPYDWVSPALCVLWGAGRHGVALTSSSISTACSSPHQTAAPLHKVEEERCHSLNRIYGLSLRHKLDCKYITEEVASSTATCLYCCCAKINTAGLLEEDARLPTRRTRLHYPSISVTSNWSIYLLAVSSFKGILYKLVIQLIKFHTRSENIKRVSKPFCFLLTQFPNSADRYPEHVVLEAQVESSPSQI